MKLDITSAYEYLEMRFNRYIRYFAAGLYVFQMILYTSVAVYAPALALSRVTSLNVYIAVSVIYLICIFYASLGGMKAVIMTDTFQTLVLIFSLLLVAAFGHSLTEGFGSVFSDNHDSGRLQFFIMDPDPTVRHTFWSVVIGGTFYWATMFCSNQAAVQKYLSVKTISQARTAVWTSCITLTIVFSINFYSGMITYHEYKHCDPQSNKQIDAKDELMPFYVLHKLSQFRGIPGLFVSGIFAASLGTVATAVNTLAAVTIKDLLGGMLRLEIPDEKGAIISRWLTIFFGVVSFALIFIIEQLGGLLQVALSFNGITGGVTLGLFSLGMFFPWANTKGALTGSLLAFIMVMWIGIGSQVAIANGYDSSIHMPTSINGCHCNHTLEIGVDSLKPMGLYRISYLWYSLIGLVITIAMGVAVSLVTSPHDPRLIDPDLISPPVLKLLKSLPNTIKEKLNLPIESKEPPKQPSKKTSTTKYESTKCGIVNPCLSLESENH